MYIGMSKPKIQKENGLLLTLKELIDLGIINSKRKRSKKGKKRRKELKALKESSNFVIKNDSNVKSTSDHMKGYTMNQPFSSTTQIPNSDYRQLRDVTNALNIRLMENKANLESNVGRTEAFMSEAQDKYKYLLNYIPENNRFEILEEQKRPLYRGFDFEDNIDVVETKGDEGFKSQIDYEAGGGGYNPNPTTLETINEESFVASNPQFEQPKRSTRLTDYFSKRDVLKPLKKQQPTEKREFTPITGIETSLTNSPKYIELVNTKIRDTPDYTNLVDEAYQEIISNVKEKSQQEKELSQFEKEDKPAKSLFETVLEGANNPSSLEFPKQGGGQVGEQEEYSPRFQDTGKKPTKEMILSLKKWYIDEKGTDEEILKTDKKNIILNGLNKILVSNYIKKGGEDDKIIKSKNPDTIKRATLLL